MFTLPSKMTVGPFLLIGFLFFFFLATTSFTFAQTDPGYTLISPVGGLNAPIGEGGGPQTSPEDYFATLFTVFIVVAVVIAVIRLMICGIQYMTSEAVSSKAAAKTCITYVIGGLLLVLTAFIVLNTIDTDLVDTEFTDVRTAGTAPVAQTIPDDGGLLPGDPGSGPPSGSGPPVAPPVEEAPVPSFNAVCNNDLVCSFVDTSTDVNRNISSVDWDFDGEGTARTTGGGSANHQFAQPGVHQVTITVTDSAGNVAVHSENINVAGVATNDTPVALFDLDYVTGSFWEVTVIDKSTDSDGNIVSWDWNWGDGTPNSAGAGPHTHDYEPAGAGIYEVLLTVTDDGGATDTYTVNFDVGPAAGPVGPFNYQLREFGSGTFVGNDYRLVIPGTGNVITSPDFADINDCNNAFAAQLAELRFEPNSPSFTNACRWSISGWWLPVNWNCGVSRYCYQVREDLTNPFTGVVNTVIRPIKRFGPVGNPPTQADLLTQCNAQLFADLTLPKYSSVSGCQ